MQDVQEANALKVIVIGAGIGGLCLAHGLRNAGVAVEVHERDERPGSRWEGYRIHIDPAGARSLRACLPEALWEAFLATAGPGGDFGYLTAQLEELVVVEESINFPANTDPAESHYAVDRRTLRRVLLAGLDDVVRFGAEFQHYEHTDDGLVAAVFADGSRAVGDVLVGADGAGSRVGRQYLPDAAPVPAGVGGVAHKLYLTEETRSWVPARLQHGMNLVLDDGPVALFTSAYRPPPGARAALERVAGHAPADIDSPYILCAVTADPALLPDDLTSLDDDVVRRTVDRLTVGWHADLRRLLAESDPTSRGGVLFSVSPEIPPWPSSRVTVLGDAIHTMPATGGLGGNTALRDARLLTRELVAAARGERELLHAIAAYEALMREHGYAAVRAALEIRDRMLSNNRVAAFAMRTWFRICSLSRTLRRRTFQDPPDALSTPRPWEQATPRP
jgi:2-polyprenyl-6-methoxyphenol hydroxylase-like FAD-dependent oxidoreductase